MFCAAFLPCTEPQQHLGAAGSILPSSQVVLARVSHIPGAGSLDVKGLQRPIVLTGVGEGWSGKGGGFLSIPIWRTHVSLGIQVGSFPLQEN